MISTLLLCLCLAAPVAPRPGDGLAPAVRSELDALLAEEVTPERVVALARTCTLAHGDVDELVWHLEELLEAEDSDQRTRIAAHRIAGHALYRRGDLKDALEHFKTLRREHSDLDAALNEAWILDAIGRPEFARSRFEELLERDLDPAVETRIRLRLALIDMEEEDAETKNALAEFASQEGRDPGMRNRAAVVLALSGRPQDAIDLFVVSGEDTARFRQEIRVAEWALRAGDAAKAQEFAWRARETARLTRDRRYALAVLVEAHRLDETLDALIERFASTEDLDRDSLVAWVDVLRETGRVDEAVELFRSTQSGAFTVNMRRELLEMYREAGEEERMVAAYRELIEDEPLRIEWREGLSRYLLERVRDDEARAVWDDLPALELDGGLLLQAAEVLTGLGLDDLALACVERCVAEGEEPYAALLFASSMHRFQGAEAEAVRALERMDALAPPEAPERMQLSEAFEALGRLEDAVRVLEGVRETQLAKGIPEDLEMRLAWLYSEVGREEQALEHWRGLWRSVKSVARRRYVEDRMMTVASRLGTLADIAIELEETLFSGAADKIDSGLLVRLYTKVGDAVSASEVIEEFFRQSGGSEVEALQSKAQVYLSCNDFYEYEKVIKKLIEVDPLERGDHMRQLAMSQLERGRPDEARVVLGELKRMEGGADSAEFEAGVLSLAGLREEAIEAYRIGMAANPERIESILLMANQMRDVGLQENAIEMFQAVAETADKDDLFTIAIDGLLNMEAPPRVMRWARRITLERLASRHDKMYLYQLISDLSEQVNDKDGMLTALEGSLPIAGEQRPSVLRELMDLTGATSSPFGGGAPASHPDRHLAYGRRLIGLEQLVPPQVYLTLGTAFLKNDQVVQAMRTFDLAADLPDRDVFERETARAFEEARYVREAIRIYERVRIGNRTDVGLMMKLGELFEQLGRDADAYELYRDSLALLLDRHPRSADKDEARKSASNDPFSYWQTRNVDDFEKYHGRLFEGLMSSATREQLAELYASYREAIDAELAWIDAQDVPEDQLRVNRFPRLLHRSDALRRMALATGDVEVAGDLDAELLERFARDEALLPALVRERRDRGLSNDARHLVRAASIPEDRKAHALFLLGDREHDAGAAFLKVSEAAPFLLELFVAGELEEAHELLTKIDFTAQDPSSDSFMSLCFATAFYTDDARLIERIGTRWMESLVLRTGNSAQVGRVFQRCRGALDGDAFEGIVRYFASLVEQDAERGASFLTLVSRMEEELDAELISEERVLELLEARISKTAWHMAGSLIAEVPQEHRLAFLRKALPEINASQRADFLAEVAISVGEEPPAELVSFLAVSFEEALDDLEGDFIRYRVGSMGQLKMNPVLMSRIAAATAAKFPGDASIRGTKIIAAARMQEAGALDEALALYVEWLGTSDELSWELQQAVQTSAMEFLPVELDRYANALTAWEESDAPKDRPRSGATGILGWIHGEEENEAAMARLCELRPFDVDLLDRRAKELDREGRIYESLVLLEQAAAEAPQRADLKKRLAKGWKKLRHPLKQHEWESRSEGDEGEEEDAAASLGGTASVAASSSVVRLSTPAAVAPSGTTVAAAPLSAARPASSASVDDEPEDEPEDEAEPDGPEGPKKLQPANQKALKRAIKDEELDEARTVLRRMWRDFKVGMGDASMVFFMSGDNEVGFGNEKLYESLIEHDFATDEMERFVRTLEPRQVASARRHFKAMVQARAKRSSTEEALAGLIDELGTRRASSRTNTMLLALLEQENELSKREEVVPHLEALIASLSAQDDEELLQLARIYAGAGLHARAARLYKWCAALSAFAHHDPFMFDPNQDKTATVEVVLAAATEHLEGAQLEEAVEACLFWADPRDKFTSGNEYAFVLSMAGPEETGPTPLQVRDDYERLILDTWQQALGNQGVARRERKLIRSLATREDGVRRKAALRAAEILAREGDLAAALDCLETAVCELDGAPDPLPFRAVSSMLLPSKSDEWPGYAEWAHAFAQAVLSWYDEGRVSERVAIDGLLRVASVLAKDDQEPEASGLVLILMELVDPASKDMLELVELARKVNEDLGISLERRLILDKRLKVSRIAKVLDWVEEHDGPEAALELGEAATEYTLDPKLLKALVAVAEKADREDRAAHWKSVRDEVEALE